MRPQFYFRHIRSRLVFWFLVVALLPLLIFAVIVYQQRVAVIKAQQFSKLVAIRDLKVNQVTQWLNDRIGDVVTISEDFEIRDFEDVFAVQQRNADNLSVLENGRELLKRYLRNYSAYKELFIADAQAGIIRISTDRAADGQVVMALPYFQQPEQTRRPFIYGVYHDQRINKPSLVLSAPIFCRAHSKRHVIGVLAARINLEGSLYALLLDRTGMGETGETLLVNQDLMALNPLRWHANASLKLQIDAAPAILAAKGRTGIIEAEDYRGVPVLAAYTSIMPAQWGFVAKQDLEEVYAPIQAMLHNIVILVMLVGSLVCLLALLLAAGIGRPIRRMAAVAGRLAAGDLNARNQIEAADELGVLAESFNAMADSIQSQIRIQTHNVNLAQVLVSVKNMVEFREQLLHRLMDITQSVIGVYYRLSDDGKCFEPMTATGASTDALTSFTVDRHEGQLGQVLVDKRIVYLKQIPADTVFTFKTMAGTALPREMLGIPLIVADKIVAVICLASLHEFSDEQVSVIEQAVHVLNIGIGNLMAEDQTRQLAQTLARRNEELQAQTEELQSQAEELRLQSAELQQQNVELAAQRVQVESANKMKSEFLSNMSHELRTPLNSIMALSKVLKVQTADKLSADETGYLDIVERNGKNLLELINDILDLSKIEAGRMTLDIRPVAIGATLAGIMERIEPIAGEKQVKLVDHIPPDLPLIQSDETRIHQVLQNLISNAVKFTEAGSVTVTAKADDTRLIISVSDTGIGIAPADLPHIFDAFRQADGSTTRSHEGTGLGLTIAAKCARMLGGKLTVDSIPHSGSTFTFSLPVTGINAADTPGADDAEANLISNPIFPARTEACIGKHILLVEDNAVAIAQVKTMLTSHGFRVAAASSGQVALQYLQHERPDGIILDLMMPGMDGFAVLKAIRGNRDTTHIPVLVLTAKDLTPADLNQLHGNHIHQLIQKGDVDQAELVGKVCQMVSRGKG